MTDIDRINELVGEKKFTEARSLLDEALKTEPENVELLKLSGLTAVNLQDWNRARADFETVVKYKPDDASSLFYLANCYNNLGDLISAKNTYISVINLRSEYTEAYRSLCVILMKLNEPENAIKYACTANAIEPEDYIFDFVIGTAYIKIKEFDKSIEPFERALKKSPNNIGIYNSLGTAYMASKRSEDAIHCYQKALELNPNAVMAYYNLGSAYQIQQNHQEACKYLKKAVELDSEDETFKVALAMSEVKTGQYEKAAELYKSLILQHPEKENYKYNLATCFEALGKISAAINMLEEMVYMNRKFILPAQKLAGLYIKTNQLNKAKDIYDKLETLNELTLKIEQECDQGSKQ